MTKTLKKTLAIVVALALCLSAFMGCFSVSAEGNAVTVTGDEITVGDTTAEVKINIASEGFAVALLDVAFTGLDIKADEFGGPAIAVEGTSNVEGAVIAVSHNSLTDGNGDVEVANETDSIRILVDTAAPEGLGHFTAATITITFDTTAIAAAGTYTVEVANAQAASAGDFDMETGAYTGEGEEDLIEFADATGDVVVNAAHVHEYSKVNYDEAGHWTECTCGEETDVEEHALSEAAEGEDGKWYQSCDCGYKKEVDAPVVGVKHTVTFVDEDGTVLDTQEVVDGTAAVAPADPTSDTDDTYFVGWDKDFSNITDDITITADYHTVSIRLKAQNLVLGGSIALNLKIGADDGETDAALSDEAVKEFGVLIWNEEDASTDYTYDETKAIEAVYTNVNGWHVTISKLSTQMVDIIEARAYVILKNGTVVYGEKANAEQPIFETSIRTYINNRLAKNISNEEKAMYIAMLNYGAYAQVEFSTNVDDLANSGLTAAQKELGEVSYSATSSRTTDGKESVNSIANTRIRNAALNLGEVIRINYGIAVDPTDATGIEEVHLLTWNQAAYDTAMNTGEKALVFGTQTSDEITVYNSSDARYRANSFDILAPEMRNNVYARGYIVYEDGTTAYTQITLYSVECYVTSKIDDADSDFANLLKATLIYSDASATYFASVQ